MTRLTRPIGLLSSAGAFALATTLTLASPASAAPAAVAFDCQAKPPIGAAQQLTLDNSVQADAPATVASGATFEITLAPDAMTVPAQAGGYNVTKLQNLALKVPVPAGSTFGSVTLTGGSNLGGTPTASQDGDVVTVNIPGPIAGGATFQLPALHLTLTAAGAAGSAIETRLSGTSYDSPGLTFTATVSVGIFPIDVPTSCFPNPSPTLTTTTIEAAPPAV